MESILDSHIHTLASSHAYNTILLAITEKSGTIFQRTLYLFSFLC